MAGVKGTTRHRALGYTWAPPGWGNPPPDSRPRARCRPIPVRDRMGSYRQAKVL